MTLLLVSIALAAAGWLTWHWRLRFLTRHQRTPNVPVPFPRVSIVVPARNEAHNLPTLLESLAKLDPAPHEVIVVDDHSIDATAAIARSYGAHVVRPPPLPDGWVGKPWACHHGAAAASGELLLFTDADTEHAPASLGIAVGQLEAEGAGLLSLLPTHRAVRPWERLQGVFQLLLLVATAAGSDRSRGERRFCIGQYLLFRREVYQQIGGHSAVFDRIAEDLAFARLVSAAGLTPALRVAPDQLRVRMYPEGLVAFIRGWRRNFREGIPAASAGGVVEVSLVMGWMLGIPSWGGSAALAGNFTSLALATCAYSLACIDIARRQRHLGRFGAASALGFPLFAIVFAVVSMAAFLDAVRGVPIEWRGRRLRSA